MAIYVSFVTAPYAAPGTEMAMLLLYNGLPCHSGDKGLPGQNGHNAAHPEHDAEQVAQNMPSHKHFTALANPG
jgi:hypothetical protein